MDDPGRQEIGSFNPITDDEWTTMAYVGDTARLCQAIVDGDLEHVEDWCSQEGVDVNRRDYTGRTPLHLAVMVSTPEIVQCLIDHDARLIARLVDGRTALHIAAARGNKEMVKALMDRSLANEEEEEDKVEARRSARKASEKSKDNAMHEDEKSDAGSEASEVTLDSEESDSMTMGSFVKVDKEKEESPVSETRRGQIFGILLLISLGWCSRRLDRGSRRVRNRRNCLGLRSLASASCNYQWPPRHYRYACLGIRCGCLASCKVGVPVPSI